MSSLMRTLLLLRSSSPLTNQGNYRAADRLVRNYFPVRTQALSSSPIDPPSNEPAIPDYYPVGKPEDAEKKRARLLYQSRKRGMLENDLLLSTFAALHLKSFGDRELQLYDHLINGPSNDWEIYYWIVGIKETPKEFESPVIELLKTHVKNLNREVRIRQPDLN